MVSNRARTPHHMPKIILGVLLSRTLDIRIARLILIFKLQHYIYIYIYIYVCMYTMVEFSFTEDNNSVDSEEQPFEYFYFA